MATPTPNNKLRCFCFCSEAEGVAGEEEEASLAVSRDSAKEAPALWSKATSLFFELCDLKLLLAFLIAKSSDDVSFSTSYV